MRRILSIALVLLMTLPLVAPAFGQTAQQRLLLCCRKGGAHHCMASATMDDGSTAPTLRAHCSVEYKPAVAPPADNGLIGADNVSVVSAEITPLRIRQVEAGYRVSFHCSRQKRGPPMTVLS